MKMLEHRKNGFTLIELLVAMTIVALLLSIVTPRYFHNVSKAEETVLKQDLSLMREAIDKYHADRGQYPDTLDDLVTKKYLRKIPVDPITQSSTTWVVVPPSGGDQGAVYDIKSGAPGNAGDGTAYADW
ncbi:MAG TPA: prepilin-type N-terminal cleavage/methylation domain-containing protein [Gallionellaceae bacterium]|nr:prepilin-type N-terminal cleavage/methylation domain-containing protein [Gallionellaceae bacterium]